MTWSRLRRACDLALFRAPAVVVLISALAALLSAVGPAQATLTTGESAIDILGQFTSASSDVTPDYVTNCVNNGASQLGFNEASATAIDATHHWLFVVDNQNHRVLVFPLTSGNVLSSKSASYVLGQPDFKSCAAATTQSGMIFPQDVAVDPVNQRLFVAEASNNRVTVWDTSSMSNGMNASHVLGQSIFTNNGSNTTQSGMGSPRGIAYDSTNTRLFVAEYGNNRVTVWNVATGSIADGENADYELGQPSGGSAFTTSGTATTQSGMNQPEGMAFDSVNNQLYVTDRNNNRVLVFNTSSITNGMNASNVIGEPDFVTNSGGTTQTGLNYPQGVALDSTNKRLFVADAGSNRVMVYNAAAIPNGENANDILGEFASASSDATPSYTRNCVDNGGALGFNGPVGSAIDATNHWLFVADNLNNRVLVFTLNGSNVISSKTPTYVLGQPDMLSCGANTTQSGMYAPDYVAVDPTNQRLFVADYTNNRVLVFSTASMSNGMNAAHVLGQANFTSGGGNTTQSGMNGPNGLAYDGTNNRLFVADAVNNRVLVYNVATGSIADGENASNELGHAAGGTAFTTMTSAGATQSGIATPFGLAFDSTNNRLFVTDHSNYRVTVFNTSSITDGMNASYVLGQPDFVQVNYGQGQTNLVNPADVALDSGNNRLFVADYYNNRVMVFNVATGSIANGENASHVLGPSSFIGGTASATQAFMNAPNGVTYDSTNNQLYVGDYNNNRVMLFSTTSITDGENASDLLGQYTSLSSTTTVSYTKSAPNNGPGTLGFHYDTSQFGGSGMVLDTVNHRFFASDRDNNRVLVYNLNSDNSFPDHTADNVIGQPDFLSSTSACTQSGLNTPKGLAFDGTNNRLFVVDNNNNRVLVFNTSSITNGMNASFELGQTSGGSAFTSCSSGAAQNLLYAPNDVAYDATNTRLFVVDSNNRIMVFNVATGSIANGEDASYELGHPAGGTAFTASGAATTQSTFNGPAAVCYDSTNTRLFVVDFWNARVMVFNVATGTIANGENASNVLGQTNYTNVNYLTTQTGMNPVEGCAYDSANSRLFVSDNLISRVTVYNVAPGVIANGEPADSVIGQTSFTDIAFGTTQSALYLPKMMTYDSTLNRLFVQDAGNNRIMVFPTNTGTTVSNGEAADYVIGQANFTSSTNAVTQSGLWNPYGVTYDSTNNQIYVDDFNNSRVMLFSTSSITNGENASDLLGEYNSNSSTSTVVYTQSGPNNGPTALGFQANNSNTRVPMALDDVNHYLFVADEGTQRVLVYTLNADNSFPAGSGGHTASYVLGATGLQGLYGYCTCQSGFATPTGLAVDTANQRLFVADWTNNRVMVFGYSSLSNNMNASFELGHPSGANAFTTSGSGSTSTTLQGPMDVAYDAVNTRLFVADNGNNRVLMYNVAVGTLANGEAASRAVGQTNLTNHTAGHSATVISGPTGVAYDPVNARLFVADSGNNRAAVFPVPSGFSNGPTAKILGQSNTTNNGAAITQAGMSNPWGVSYDANNSRLFVGDNGNNRVLVFNVAPSVLATGENASFVLGASNFTSAFNTTTQSGFGSPHRVFYDPGTTHLFVEDGSGARILIFDGTAMPQGLPGYE